MNAVVVSLCIVLAAGNPVPDDTSAAAGDPPSAAVETRTASSTLLRLAVSTDGLVFDDVGPIARGAAPDLVLLPNGHLLLAFDQPVSGRALDVGLAVARSRDQGRTWTHPQPARIVDAAGHPIRGRHGALVQAPDKRIRLYFTTDWKGSAVVLSAVTRNGVDFRVDVADPVIRGDRSDPVPRAAPVGRQVCMWVSRIQKEDAGEERRGRVRWLLSPDGRRFRDVNPLQLPEAGLIGSIVNLDRGLRAFTTSPEGIGSLVSTNGLNLEPEPGVRVPRGADPSVVRLPDGSCAMVYCTDARPARDRRHDLDAGEFLAGTDGGSGGGSHDEPWESFDAALRGTHAASQAGGSERGESSYGPEDWPSTVDGFAPIPDFAGSFDYVDWFRQQVSREVPDDASAAYGAFMPDWLGPGGGDPNWPDRIDDKFNGDDVAPLEPWDPLEHPNWEATHQAIQPLLEQFRLAGQYENCSAPLRFPTEAEAGTSDHPPMLIDTILPSLRNHRMMVKATLADAWRIAEDGRVDPDGMIDALEASLRTAGHVQQAPTLIHHLVGIAEKSLAYSSAREALAQDLIPEDRLDETFRRLVAADRPSPEPANWIRFEHAMVMDLVQNLYQPTGVDGQPEVDVEFVNKIFSMTGEANADSPNLQQKIDSLCREDPAQAAADLDAYYRAMAELWEAGAPHVQSWELAEMEEEAVRRSTLASLLAPSFSRAYELAVRSEASRRATQLSYAMHVFKIRNGRWPYSLDELPPDVDVTMRTDPLSGYDFVYRLTPDGPTLYSASNNGLDDGGVHSRRFGDGVAEGQSDDHVFWPPQ